MEQLRVFLTLLAVFSGLGLSAVVILTALRLSSKIFKIKLLENDKTNTSSPEIDELKQRIKKLEHNAAKKDQTIIDMHTELDYYKKLSIDKK